MLKTMTQPIEHKKDASWTSTILVGVPMFMAVFALGGDIGKWIGGFVLLLLLIGTPGTIRRMLVLFYGVFALLMLTVVADLIGHPLHF